MAKVKPNEVKPDAMLNAIMGKLYEVLTSGDDTVPKSEDNFFSWATPGIPVKAEDFRFLSQGLTGAVRNAALTPAILEELRGQDTARLYMQAENFARLVDFVPDLASATNNQLAKLIIMNDEGTLSERYEYILRMSQVMQSALPKETENKIKKFRELLSVTKTKKNLIDDSEIEVTEPSPMVQAYNEKLMAYEDTALEYNSHRVDALAADDAKAVHYWAINANILRNKVKAAMNAWVTNGYKNEYEQIAAFIDQVGQRDMSLLKEEYKDTLNKARLTGIASGSDFYYTSLVPANFMTAAGWTGFSFRETDYDRYIGSSYKFSKSSARAGGGFLGIGGGGSSSSESGQSEFNVHFDKNSFKLGFEIAQIPIVRPWFKTAFLVSKTWRFDQNNPEAKGEIVSDGGAPAKGLIPAYPTSIIFIKDLWMCVAKSKGFIEMDSHYRKSSKSGGGGLGWGWFNLGGSYERESGSGEWSLESHYDSNTQTLRVPGVQIIGFKCHVLPKSPNPLPGITKWV